MHSLKISVGTALCWAILLAPALGARAQDGEQVNLNEIEIILGHSAPFEFVGGSTIEIIVNISSLGQGTVTAMGLYETLPEGWVYGGLRAIAGDPPNVAPDPGAMGVLDFAWLASLSFPTSITFAYTLDIPASESGARFLSGQVEYRTNSGKRVSAPSVVEFAGLDTTPPTLELLGPNPVQLNQGTPYEEPGYLATDDVDGDLSGSVVVVGNVDTSMPGSYFLRYSLTDRAGNRSTVLRRDVQVLAVAVEPETSTPVNTGVSSSGTSGGTTSSSGSRVYGGATRYGDDEIPATPTRSTARTGLSTSASTPNAGRSTLTRSQVAEARKKAPRISPSTREKFTRPDQRIAMREKPARVDGDKLAEPKGAAHEVQAGEEAGTVGADAPVKVATAERSALTASSGGGPAALAAARDPAGVLGMAPAALSDAAPGFFERSAMTIKSMTRGQILALLALVAVMTMAAVFGAVGWRMAYSGPDRRRPRVLPPTEGD